MPQASRYQAWVPPEAPVAAEAEADEMSQAGPAGDPAKREFLYVGGLFFGSLCKGSYDLGLTSSADPS